MFLIFSTEKQNKFFFSASVLSHCPVTNDKSMGQKKTKEVYYQVYLIEDSKRNE